MFGMDQGSIGIDFAAKLQKAAPLRRCEGYSQARSDIVIATTGIATP
jgi:hypothetical protein